MKPVNRYLKDKDMDRIDHALGRPLDPMGETYRSYFAAGGTIADELAASPHWEAGARTVGDGSLRYFYVTREGRKALAEHLRAIGDPHRAFVVTFESFQSTIVATSRAKARYSYYLDLTDSWPMPFKDYCRRVSVRAA
jgi:hypothetical protein